jgi:hypothetical protein
MYPGLSEETIRDLATGHQRMIEAAERRQRLIGQVAMPQVSHGAAWPYRLSPGVVLASIVALPKRIAWPHS